MEQALIRYHKPSGVPIIRVCPVCASFLEENKRNEWACPNPDCPVFSVRYEPPNDNIGVKQFIKIQDLALEAGSYTSREDKEIESVEISLDIKLRNGGSIWKKGPVDLEKACDKLMRMDSLTLTVENLKYLFREFLQDLYI